MRVIVSRLTGDKEHMIAMRFTLPLIIAITLTLFPGPGALLLAQGAGHAIQYEAHDEERARRALENGEILPLDRVIAPLNDRGSGEISGVELEKEKGIWIYEFKIISPAGEMQTVRINAMTGNLIGKAGK